LTVSAVEARALSEAVLSGLGATPDGARAQTGLLVEADLRGRPSHGLQRLPVLAQRIEKGLIDPAAQPQLEWRSPAFAAVDANDGFGVVAVQASIGALAERIRETGVGVAAIRQASHIGMLAPHLEQICADGLIGIMLTTSEALVHPAGGRDALVGTNPIGIGIPADPGPFILDMSTAAISAGEIIAHANRGDELPPGRAVDSSGAPTTDPEAALEGAISPFGGAKGYGLGLGFELLVAVLTSTALGRDVLGTLDVEHPSTKGDLLLMIDPATLGLPAPERYLADYLEELRCAATAPGVQSVLVPGDRMRFERERRLVAGIEYPPELWRQLLDLRGAVRA
jgi:L-2-hydroxycarboxylate dehydrogenase (NAD+)